MNAEEIVKMLEADKLSLNPTNLAILQYLHPEMGEYYERYGILIHNKLGVASGIPLPNYIGSIDATIEAVRHLLPHADWSIYSSGRGHQFEGTVWLKDQDDNGDLEFSKLHNSPSIALLIAMLEAVQNVEKDED